MIRNLNQLDFRAYGIIPMERVHGGQTATVEGSSRMLELQEREALPVYRAAEDTWVRNEAGMTVLSVSVDGDYYQSFYLDKTVCLKTGVYFTLAAFRQKAAVTLTSHQEPEITGDSRPADSVYLSHQIRAKGLCTFFYQDRERGFSSPARSIR